MIIAEADLPALRMKHQGQRMVLAFGTFDLLHTGHLNHLAWCRQQGDILVVAVNDDLKVRARKGWERPILPQDDRLVLVDALAMVDYTILSKWQGGHFNAPHWQLGTKLQPDVVCINTEPHHDVAEWQAALPGTQVAVHTEPRLHGTTEIIKTIVERHAR